MDEEFWENVTCDKCDMSENSRLLNVVLILTYFKHNDH